jgi:hypothetical protein
MFMQNAIDARRLAGHAACGMQVLLYSSTGAPEVFYAIEGMIEGPARFF